MTRRNAIRFGEKDAPLRADVGELGALVGDMLREQGGDALYERVEAARQAAIARRTGEDPTGSQLEALLDDLAPNEDIDLLRAFSTWFQMVNLAERVHRIRRRRDYQRAARRPQPESVGHALRVMRDSGVAPETVAGLFADLCIEPVFTAHPTEATRRTLLEKQQRIARHLVQRMDPSLTPDELNAISAQLRSELTASWQTEEHPEARITVADERESILFYLTHTLYRAAPAFYETVERELARSSDSPPEVPSFLRFSSWVGGDMDGNPNVTDVTIRESLRRHRKLIIRRYLVEVEELFWRLSQSEHKVGMSAVLQNRYNEYAGLLRDHIDPPRRRDRDMLYRLFLRLVHRRLEGTLEDKTFGYSTVDELLDDINLVATSLAEHRGEHAGLFQVRRLRRRIETFGFHLATLDVRQDSLVHRMAIAQGLGDAGWLERTAEERGKILTERLMPGKLAAPLAGGEELKGCLAVMRAISDCRGQFGARAIGPYIISMAQNADDVLSVLLLASWAGCLDGDGHVPLDVAPLFETVEDLARGATVMNWLLENPAYQRHIEQRSRRQTVMIGYSDSNKDGGLIASRWALQQGQRELLAVLTRHKVRVTFFHGRGGTTSRGGGKVYQAVLAAPRNSVQCRLRVTEQGEIINAKYGLRGIALRTLEQATAAVLLASVPKHHRPRPPEWQTAMDLLATTARNTYRKTVYESEGFADYFTQSTPVDVIARMSIGSRPSSRRKGNSIENLRAIPWVFAWTQSRQVFPGWYGVGSALRAVADEMGDGVLREMCEGWLFFSNIIDDVEMVLAKADMDIAAHYAALADPALQPFFADIRAEFQLTCDSILALKGNDNLLDSDPTLQRAILLRNPYVDPISLMQVDLLRRWRASDRSDDALLQALLASVNGIAQGLQNTG